MSICFRRITMIRSIENSTVIFTQFNEKTVCRVFKVNLRGRRPEKKRCSPKGLLQLTRFLYYDMIVDKQKISTLELIYNEDAKQWNVRTVIDARNFYIGVRQCAGVCQRYPPQRKTISLNTTSPPKPIPISSILNQAPLVCFSHRQPGRRPDRHHQDNTSYSRH